MARPRWLSLKTYRVASATKVGPSPTPAKAVTNPMFYVKLAAIGLGVWLTWFAAPREEADPAFQAGPLPRRVRLYGAGLMAIWIFVIIAGRLLAYTYSFQNILW